MSSPPAPRRPASVRPPSRSQLRTAPDAGARAKIRLLRSFDPASPPGADVPDPYYGGDDGFEQVLDHVEAACEGLLRHVRREAGL